MSNQKAEPKVAADAIRVESTATVQGRAATTISVEVDEKKLGQAVAGADQAHRAVAVVPHVQQDGKQEWKEEELLQSGRRVTEDDRVVKTFNATITGAQTSREGGVAIKVETPAGSVWSNEQHAAAATRDADKAPDTNKKG